MSLNERVKNLLSFVLRFGLSFLLLWFLFTKIIDIESTIEVLKSADVTNLIWAGLVFLLIHGFLLTRWNILIKALDLSVTFINIFRFFFVGLFGNLFLPSAIGGDIIKIVGLCKYSDQKPRVVASVLIDRLSGFGGMVFLAITMFILGYNMIDDKTLMIPVISMGVACFFIIMILFNEKMYSFGCKIFAKFPKIQNKLMEIHYDLTLLKDKKKEGWKAIGISVISQATLCVSYYFTAKALHQDISFIYFLIFVPLICVASSFPSIGGLGVREAGAAYLFAKIGVDSGIAVSLSLINFAFMAMVGLLGGVIFYVTTFFVGRLQHNQSNSSASSS